MRNKILWLSILGLALAKPPSPIDSTASNFGEQQKQRSSRSIWPFTSSATTTEAPATYSPPLLDNNEWFIQGETPLPQGIDLNKYPVWKVHKYNGIDLHPVNLQPENTYPPEVDPGYSSGYSSSSDFSQNSYQNRYQEFLASRDKTELESQSVHGTYATGYPAGYSSSRATYPAKQDTYQSGEFYSSSFTPETNSFNIQTQQKHEVYAPPQPLKDVRPAAVSVAVEHPQFPQASYGLPNVYHAESMDYQEYSQAGQRQVFGTGDEQPLSSIRENPDLSFLDDLGGLAPFLPDPAVDQENSQQQEESDTSPKGFFENLFSRFRGSTEAPADEVAVSANENPAYSGGFLSSMFGLRGSSQSSETGSAPTESSGNVFSSLFYSSETEKPAVVLPTTYYLPKTRGSYVAVKIPTNTASGLAPSIGQYGDVSNIAFHEVPKVPFTQREIPRIPGPTLASGYPYNVGYSDGRNSGFAGPTINTNYQPSVSYDHARLPTSNNFSEDHGDALYVPRAEYLYSANDKRAKGVSTSSSQLSPGINYYHQGQQNSQDLQNPEIHQIQSTVVVPQLVDELPRSYLNTMSSSYADESDQNRNLNTQGNRYQSFDTTNSNFQGTSNTQEKFEHNRESVSFDQTSSENEPISAPQISDGFVPSLAYGISIKANDQLNFNINNQENNQQTTSTSENIAYDHSRDNIGETLLANFDNSPNSGHLVPPREMEPAQTSVSDHEVSISTFNNPGNTLERTETYGFLPINEAIDFHEKPSDKDDGDTRFIKNLSSLTSYGIPTQSYDSDSFVSTSSNMRSIVMPVPTKDEVNDGLNINMDKDVSRSTLSEQLPTMKAGRVIRKVIKRKNLFESNHLRRSAPERQAPTEQGDTSIIIRSETDSIPEVRGSRQFNGANIVDGYSKVQHQENEEHRVVADNPRVMKSVNSVLGAVHE